MNLWEWAYKHIKAIYWTMFFLGVGLLVLSWIFKIFSWKLVLASIPIAAGLTAAYLWIRQDIWRDDETIRELTNSKDTQTDRKLTVSQEDLISRRADSRIAFVLLVLVAVAQALDQYFSSELKSNWLAPIGELLMFVSFFNCIARWREGIQKSKFQQCRMGDSFKDKIDG